MKLSELRRMVTICRAWPTNDPSAQDEYRGLYDRMLRELAESGRLNLAGTIATFIDKAAQLDGNGECDMAPCSHCDRMYPDEEGLPCEASDDRLCRKCADDHYIVCYNCETYVHRDDSYQFHGDSYCNGCYDDAFRECDGCGRTYARDGLSDGMCDDCYESDDDDGETDEPPSVTVNTGLEATLPGLAPPNTRIWDYMTRAPEVIIGPWLSAPGEATDVHGNKRSKTPTLWLGFELEVRCKVLKSHAAGVVNAALANRGIIKEDSSVGRSGFEIVSLPGTIKYHQTQWGPEFFKHLYATCKGWSEDGCGIHVHINKAALSPLVMGKMAYFVNAPPNKEFIAKVAGRGATEYCYIREKKLTAVRQKVWTRRTIGGQGVSYQAADSNTHREAVNMSNQDTVEIRIFRSNVSQIGFLKNIEFVDALVNFSRVASTRQLSREDFMAYMDGHRGIYPNFTQWAVRENLWTTRHKPKADAEILPITA